MVSQLCWLNSKNQRMLCIVANAEHALANFQRMFRKQQHILSVHCASYNKIFCVCSGKYDKIYTIHIRPKYQFLFCFPDLWLGFHKKLSEENIRFRQLQISAGTEANTNYQNPIYVFPEIKLRGLVPNSYIHVTVTDPGNI